MYAHTHTHVHTHTHTHTQGLRTPLPCINPGGNQNSPHHMVSCFCMCVPFMCVCVCLCACVCVMQLWWCFKKWNWSFWHNPGHNLVRFMLTFLAGWVYGAMFWKQGQVRTHTHPHTHTRVFTSPSSSMCDTVLRCDPIYTLMHVDVFVHACVCVCVCTAAACCGHPSQRSINHGYYLLKHKLHGAD